MGCIGADESGDPSLEAASSNGETAPTPDGPAGKARGQCAGGGSVVRMDGVEFTMPAWCNPHADPLWDPPPDAEMRHDERERERVANPPDAMNPSQALRR